MIGADRGTKSKHEMQFGIGRRRCEIGRRLQHARAILGKIDFYQDQEFAAGVAAHKSVHSMPPHDDRDIFNKDCANVAFRLPVPY